MINYFSFHCRLISEPWYDLDRNCWIRIAVRRDEPYGQENGENRYYDDIFDVIIARHREQYLNTRCYKGQMVMLTGCVRALNHKPIMLANDIWLITDQNGGYKK